MIAARHSHVSQNKLREERQVETDEDNQRCELRRRFRVHAARHLGPPEMESAEIREHHATYHHVMEVRDDKVSMVDVHIHSEGGKKEAGYTADGKQSQEC